MDYSVHDYTGDGIEADWQFRADRIFATDVLAFVESLPNGDRWFLKSSQQVGPGKFVVTFVTNEYFSPGDPYAELHVKVSAPEDPTGEWTLSIG